MWLKFFFIDESFLLSGLPTVEEIKSELHLTSFKSSQEGASTHHNISEVFYFMSVLWLILCACHLFFFFFLCTHHLLCWSK